MSFPNLTSVSPQFTTGTVAPTPTFTPPAGNGSGNQNNNATTSTIATSASLYLYTFLATLVLLLSVSAAIVIRSFVLRRRHRLMMEEAIRNGTWLPPAPPTRPVRVDLSKKPVLWEAYIDGKGDLVGYTTGGELGAGDVKKITDVWRTENSKEWDMIKPFAAAYLSPDEKAAANTVAEPTSTPGTPPIPGLATIPSVGSLRSANVASPASPAAGTGPQTDIEAANVANAGTPASSTRSRTPRHRAILSRAFNLLNPTPNPTSPLPAPPGSGPNAGGAGSTNAEIGITELKGPQVMRVAVLIAMPSPPPGVSLSASGISSSTVSSASGLHSASGSSSTPPLTNSTPAQTQQHQQPVPVHPLELSVTHPPRSHTLSSALTDDEHPLPHLEMGVADILVVPSDHPGADSAHRSTALSGKRKAAQRGSLASVATGMSEGSEV